MATKAKKAVEPKPTAVFTKQQILAAAKYTERRDLLAVLLEDDRPYTLAEVNKSIDEFMQKGVQ